VPKIKLSDVGLRALQPPETGTLDYWDSTFKGGLFGCRVSQGGTKTFVVKLQNSRRAIGRWPLISLADARGEAKRLLAEKTLGKVRPQSITVEKAVELFLAEKEKGRRTRTVADLRDRLKRHFDIKGQLADVTHGEIVRRLAKIKTPQEHNAALRVGKNFFTWSLNRRYITDNPITGFSTHSTTSRSRILSHFELKEIWDACSDLDNDLPHHYRVIVKLLLLCGQRRGEIAALHSSWINAKDKTCTLPSTVTKNRHEFTFPLGNLALAILNPLPEKPSLLFPARGKSSPFNGWSKSKSALDRASGVTGWTLLGRIGISPHIAERLVNHVSSRSTVDKIYDHYTYMPEMREAIEKYEKFLQSIEVG
jgi:integrase